MLRASRIPPLLSRICGDGVNAALLITSDGELLGSTHWPPAQSALGADGKPNVCLDSNKNRNPISFSDEGLDVASIGALAAEVAGDYRRAGNELLVLNPSQTPPTGQIIGGQQQGGGNGSGGAGNGCMLKCLLVELELGMLGISSAGADCYVVALADGDVELGLLKARLTALAGYVQDALSQLAQQP